MDKLSKALNDFQNWLKGNGNKVATKEITRRAVLTKFGFIIYADIEVPDHPDFLKKKSDIESRSNEMATRHDKEVWTYIAQGFPGSRSRPSAEMVGQRLKTNPDFRSGLLKLQDRHKTEYAALKGELKTAIEDNEIYKQEARSEQVRSMTTDQKRELVNESSRARYQTEEGKLDRQYRNINHYGRQGERIKEVQRTRYQEDEDFRAKQIERSRARLQKPGIKELGAAEARERTRLKNNPLNEQCDCGCNGNLKTHRANFRKKFWSEYNPVKEGGFKILIAGIDNDAYWSGESWRRCIIAGGYRGLTTTDDSWIPKGWTKSIWDKNLPGTEKYKIEGALDPDGNFHPKPGHHKLDNLNKQENLILNYAANAIRHNNIHTLGLSTHNIDVDQWGRVPTQIMGGNRATIDLSRAIPDKFGISHIPVEENEGTNKQNPGLAKRRFNTRKIYDILGEEHLPDFSTKRSKDWVPYEFTEWNEKGEPINLRYKEGIVRSSLGEHGKVQTGPVASHQNETFRKVIEQVYRNRNGGHLFCENNINNFDHNPNLEGQAVTWSHFNKPFAEINKTANGKVKDVNGVWCDLISTLRPEHADCAHPKDSQLAINHPNTRIKWNNLSVNHPDVQKGLDYFQEKTGKDWRKIYDSANNKYNFKKRYKKEYSKFQKKRKFTDEEAEKFKFHPDEHPDFKLTDDEVRSKRIVNVLTKNMGRTDDLSESHESRNTMLLSPKPTGKKITPQNLNITSLTTYDVYKKPNYPAPERDRQGNITAAWEGYTQQGKRNDRNESVRTNQYHQAKYSENIRNPKHQALIASREKLFPQAYSSFREKFGREPLVCEISGHDEVTQALRHSGNYQLFDIDHHKKEIDDFDPAGEMTPMSNSIVTIKSEHRAFGSFRKKKFKEHQAAGKSPEQVRTAVSRNAVKYVKDKQSENANMFNPRRQKSMLSGLIDGPLKFTGLENRTSSWNGFKVLDNL